MNNLNVKIASCIPIGALDKFGYQYIWRESIAIQARAFDKVYLYSTTRDNIDIELNIENVELVIDDDALLEHDESGNEVFSIYKIYNAYNNCLCKAKNDGMDFVLCSAINFYIDDINSVNMRKYLKGIKKNQKPFGYFAKAFQLYNKVCYPNSLIPLIANLDFINDIKIDIDVMEYKGKRFGWRGGWHANFPFYIIDVFGIETFADFEKKFNWYTKVYMKEWQGKEVFFDAARERKKFQNKVGKIAINYNYKNTDLVERISEKVVEDSLVRSIPFKSKSKYVLILKSILIKIFEFFGLMRFIGNN